MMVTASAVSPSAEAVVYTGSGDGMILIGGIPSVDFSDLGLSYPYTAVMLQDNFSDELPELSSSLSRYHDYVLMLLNAESPIYWDTASSSLCTDGSVNVYLCTLSDVLASAYGFPSFQWMLGYSGTDGAEYGMLPFYSNNIVADYPYSHNYLDNIISLDGYEYVWWDGNTEGLATYNDYMYHVSSSLSVPSSAFSVSNYKLQSSSGFVATGNRVFLNDLTSFDDGWSLSNPLSSYDYSVLDLSSDGNLYFALTGSYNSYLTYFLAYVPGTGAPVVDFSGTELTISNPEYDFQSASFDVSWSGLPEIPYPENIQYYLTARLNDASSATHPYTYIGSSDDPPSGDVPVSFTFDDLQPSTEYISTVELRYAFGGNTSFDSTVSSGVTATVSFTTLSDGSISEGDKAIIDAIQNTNQQHEQWIDSEMGSAVGDLNEDIASADQQINDLNNQEEAFKDDAFSRFQEVSASFSGFDGTVGSGIGLAGTLFSRFFNCLGDYAIIYTFPLILGLAMVIIGRLSRSSFSLEDKDHDQFTIDGW